MNIGKAFAWMWAIMAAFLFGVFLGPMGIDVMDSTVALLIIVVGVIVLIFILRPASRL